MTAYHTAWYCPDCKKMTIDAADLRTQAEENEFLSLSAQTKAPKERNETEEGE